jgi:tungstate transport system substrate-binding protein
MGETLQVANEKSAYTLTDKATYMSFKKNLGHLKILLIKNKSLKNVYSVIDLNPKKVKFNQAGAKKFKEWLLSQRVLKMIASFGEEKYGEPLFIIDRK